MKLKTGNQQRKIDETNSCFFEKVNKINVPLARRKVKRERKFVNIKNEMKIKEI